MLLGDPAAAFLFFSGKEVCPGALRQIVLCNALIVKDRCNQKVIAKHILLIHIMTGLILCIFKHHASHGRHAGHGSIDRGLIQIRHQACFESCKEAYHIHCLIIIYPRHSVGGASVKSGMGGKQSECYPALIHICGRGIFKAADIMRPEAEAAHQQGQTAAKAFFHGFII